MFAFHHFCKHSSKIKIFEGRNDIQISYISYSVLLFPDRPMKGRDILDF